MNWLRAIIGTLAGALFGAAVAVFLTALATAWGLAGFMSGVGILCCAAAGLAISQQDE